jgi:DNA-directed RNA polymerase subunit RPC12/RpoP
MALIKCAECGNEVSTTAKACPKCGAKVVLPKKPTSTATKLMAGLLGIGIVGGIVAQRGHEADAAAVEAAKTPQQRAAEKAARAKENAQFTVAANGAAKLKQAMKDPESFSLTSLIVHADGAACYEYRAKNSFGAILPSEAVLSPTGKFTSKDHDGNAFVHAWNTECTKADGQDIADLVKRMGAV